MHRDSASLLASGDIDGLLALHRDIFGPSRMDGEGDGGAGDGDGDAGTGGGWTPPASQADLDRIIADRVNRTKSQFKDYNDLKSKAAEFDRLTESQKSELQKAQDRAEKAEQAVASASQRVVMAEVRAIATGEFEDPSDAHLYLGDVAKLLDKNGDPDPAAIEEALKDVLKAKPHLAAKSRSTDVGLGARGSNAAPDMNDFIRQGAGRK